MKTLSGFLKVWAAIVVFGFSATSSASLITNGSFEENDVPYGSWRWFTADEVNGWDGSNIEIWDHLKGEEAYDGQQFAELNAHPRPSDAFSIYQDFNTEVGQVYNVSFAYQARRENVNETFLSSILDSEDLGSTLFSWTLDDHTTDGWSLLNGSFVAASEQSRIQFTTITPETYTYGNFVDDIKVTAEVPEPSTIALLVLGMLGLRMSRRKTQ